LGSRAVFSVIPEALRYWGAAHVMRATVVPA